MGSGCGSDGSPVASDKTGEIQKGTVWLWSSGHSMVDFFFDDPSSNPAHVYTFSVYVAQKNENKQKGARVVQFKKINYVRLQSKTLAV